MKITKLLVGVLLLGSVGLAAPTAAADVGSGAAQIHGAACGESVIEEILGILLASGNIDRAQYEALCRKARGESEPAPAQTAAVSAEGPSWDFKWSNGFELSRSDGAFKLGFGGRVMADAGFIWASSELERRFEEAGIDPKDGSGVSSVARASSSTARSTTG